MSTANADKSLIIVSCGKKKKIWQKISCAKPVMAKDVYTSGYFKLCKQYAELFGSSWVILSAKYGFIAPESLIDTDYDISFKKKFSDCVSAEELKRQAKDMGFQAFGAIISLCGKAYSIVIKDTLEPLGLKIYSPLEGLKIGYRQKKLKDAIRQNRPFNLNTFNLPSSRSFL